MEGHDVEELRRDFCCGKWFKHRCSDRKVARGAFGLLDAAYLLVDISLEFRPRGENRLAVCLCNGCFVRGSVTIDCVGEAEEDRGEGNG
jgi:hypothetical protein